MGAPHRVDLRRAKGPASLQLVHLRVQQLSLHQQLADLGLQPSVSFVLSLRRATLQPRLARGQKPIVPLRGPCRRDPQLPRHGLQILTTQQTQHRLALAPDRKPPHTAAPVALRAPAAAADSSSCFPISTLLLRELSRNQVSKKTLGRWTSTEAVRTQSRVLTLGDSLSAFMRKLRIYSTSGGSTGGRTRLRNQMKRLFRCQVGLICSAARRAGGLKMILYQQPAIGGSRRGDRR